MASSWWFVFVPALSATGIRPTSLPDPNHMRRRADSEVGQDLANPAGCAIVRSTERDLELLQGVFPISDFQDMLGSAITNRSAGAGSCKETLKTVKWCPVPKQQPYLGRGSELTQAVEQYLQRELEGTDASQPLAIAALQMGYSESFAGTSKGLQVLNFLCGWDRLGLLENRSAIFVTNEALAAELRRWSPKARVLYHEEIGGIVGAIGRMTQLTYANRALKMALAQLLLNLGRDIILSDIDVYWVRDPTPVFQKAALEDGVEFAAMKDCCWLELNSGFLYYKNTAATRRLLEVALTTERSASIGGCADNDQYLINCGFARAVLEEKLNYRILPQMDFAFGSQANVGGRYVCHNDQAAPDLTVRWLGDGLPYIWHTAGYSGTYDREMDVFETFGLVDLDRDNGRCLTVSRGQPADAEALARLSARSCSTGPDGFTHAGCYGACATPPDQAESLRSSFSQAYESWRTSARDH